MLKKFLTFATTLALLIFVFVPAVQSESLPETEFDKRYKEYIQKIEDYNKAHDAYVLARSQYLKFKTLQSRTDAQGATLVMLQARDTVFISYLETLKSRLQETLGVKEETRSLLNLKIDEEISWLNDHKGRLSSAGTLEDLVKDSDEAKSRHKLKTESVFYEVLAWISNGKIAYFRERLGSLFSKTRDKFYQIKDEGKFSTGKIQTIDRWIFYSEGRIGRAEEKHLEAEKVMSDLSAKQGSFVGVYDKVILTLRESQQYLKESSSYLKEVIKEVKTAE